MPCTTILVGKRASYDGSTIVARNEDAGNGKFTPKQMIVVEPAAPSLQKRYLASGYRA